LYVDTLKEFIGIGRFGKVYSVENPRFPKKMALKLIDMENGTDKNEALKILDAELRASIKLVDKSPFLVKVVEYFIDSGYCFLVMDYFSGGDLEKVLKKNKVQGIKMSRMVLYYYYLLL
jgi:serine/threonine protein kinase